MPVTITKPIVGGSSGTWGSELNTALDTIVSAVNSVETAGSQKLSATTVTARGDLIVASAASTVTRLGVGANGTTLTADSGQPTGMAWKLAPGTLIAQLRQTNTQQLLNNTPTNILWNQADFDRYNKFSGSAYSYVPGVAGWYLLEGAISFSANTSGIRNVYWYAGSDTLDGSGSTANALNNGTLPQDVVARPFAVYLTATNAVTLQAYHNAGSALTTGGQGTHQCSMTITWLGPQP